MAQLEDIVQRIVVEGTGEAGHTLEQLAETGKAAFDKIEKAASGGQKGFQLFSTGALAIGAAVAALAYEVGKFILAQQEMIIHLDSLGKASKQSAGEIEGIEQAVKKFGASTEGTNRFITNLYNGMAQSYATIARQAEESALAQRSADLSVVQGKQAVADASINAQFASADFKNKMAGDAIAVQSAYNKMKFAAQDFALQVKQGELSAQSAFFNERHAIDALNESRGYFKDDYTKKKEKDEELQAAVDQAHTQREAVDLANTKAFAQHPIDTQQNALDLTKSLGQEAKDGMQGVLEIEKSITAEAAARLSLEKARTSQDEQRRQDTDSVIGQLKSGQLDPRVELDNAVKAIRTEAFSRGGGTIEGANKELVPLLADFFKEAKQQRDQGNTGALSTAQEENIIRTLGRFSLRGDQGADISKIREGLEQGGEAIKVSAEKMKDSIPPEAVENANKMVVASTQFSNAVADFSRVVGQITAQAFVGIKEDKPQGNADGGYISGPGSATSDSIPARLSNGEFVVKAAAVRNYGAGLFHALNNMNLAGFADGGFVGGSRAPLRFADGGMVGGNSSTINLSIDGNKFEGLKAQKGVADSLTRFAVGRQAASAGRKPSWMR